MDFCYVVDSPFSHVLLIDALPTNAQTLDITFVVQKTRTVEFLVKPPEVEQGK